MSFKDLKNTYISAGYTLSAKYTGLTIESTATIGGTGVVANFHTEIDNFGLVKTTTHVGIELTAGGTVKQGGTVTSNSGGVYITGGSGTVENTGTIDALSGVGVHLYDGGKLVNGSSTDVGASITASTKSASNIAGVAVEGAAGTVVNYGAITSSVFGVGLVAGGSVANGAAGDKTASISGGKIGVYALALASVANFGTIHGSSGAGVRLAAGGTITNAGGGFIQGDNGVYLNASSTVINSGTIKATGGHSTYGVQVYKTATGVSLTNGSLTNAAALIEGYGGIQLNGVSTAVNFGTIAATGAAKTAGFYLGGGGSLTNGAAGHQSALIEGVYGGAVNGVGTIINFGTIKGTSGKDILFKSARDVLVVEAGCEFDGSVNGGGGALDLASGKGTISGIAAGNVTISGSMKTATFSNFGTVDIFAGASFTETGSGTIAAGHSLIDAGTLTVAGTLVIAGALTTKGTLGGAGTLALSGGTAGFGAGTSLTVAKVTQSGATSVATVATASLTDAGKWTQTAGTLSVSKGDKISFSGTGDSFAGTLAGAGTVAFTGGSDTLTGTTLSATSVIISGPTVTLGGTITLTHTLSATTANLVIGASGATLSGSGALVLSDLATNRVYGATATATLTNKDTISGACLLGDGTMTLVNAATGIIDGTGANALTIDTGARTISNAGLIEATGKGGTTIAGALANTGTLAALGGTLTVKGAVTGVGSVQISGGTADFVSTITENVTFTGPTGVLELDKSISYAGAVTGLSKSGTNSLDLRDIAFIKGTTTASYSGTTTSGELSVTDGTHTAFIELKGDYTTSKFTVSADGHGGTKVVDPTGQAGSDLSPRPPMHSFVQAAAGFAGTAASQTNAAFDDRRLPLSALCAPRAQFA